jgi:hypothetical protein
VKLLHAIRKPIHRPIRTAFAILAVAAVPAGAVAVPALLSWLICLVREYWPLDRVEDGLLWLGDEGREGLLGAVDGDGR